jgi:hypothetical protein
LVKKIENYMIGAGLFEIMAITGRAQACVYVGEKR